MTEDKRANSDFTLHWIIVGMMLCMLLVYNLVCHFFGTEIQINIAEEHRVFIRTVFYVFTIILFPLVNLLRHILLRLNQTMPGDTPAKTRYLITVIVTLAAIETCGLFGLIMFILGDGYNTLYIFSLLALLGIFIHRPKNEEYQQIISSLADQKGYTRAK